MAVGRTNVLPPGLRNITFSSPGSVVGSYAIKDKDNATVFSGTTWSSSMPFRLYTGNYTLTVTAYGDSFSFPFKVRGDEVIDLAEYFSEVTVTGIGAVPVTHSVDSNVVGSDNVFHVIRSSSVKTYTGKTPSYGGLSTDDIATVQSVTFTPDQASVTVATTLTGMSVLLTSSGDLAVPIGCTLRLYVIGGGGGGCSGHVAMNDYTVPSGTHIVTIGAGSTSTGGATSFGTIATAQGGSATSGGAGCEGKAGTFGGGGGGAGGSSSGSGSSGGSGGTYGGSGGKGGAGGGSVTGLRPSVRGSAGSYGSSGTVPNAFDTATADDVGISSVSASGGSGGAGGYFSSTTQTTVSAGGGGGGGGGGYGAVGGAGTAGGGMRTSSAPGGDGGGGGGLLGGDGGGGSSYAKGYGAGGGYGGGGGMLNVSLVSSSKGADGAILLRWVA